MPRVKSDEKTDATEEPIENSVEVNEVQPAVEEEIQKPKRPKREKSPAQIEAWNKLQIANKKKFEERKAAKERGEVVVPHGRNIDKQSKEVLEKLDKLEKEPPVVEPVVEEEEEEIEYVKQPKKKVVKKKKRRIVVEQDSSSSDEEIVISRRRKSKKKEVPTPTAPIPIPINDTPKEDTSIQKEKPISTKPPEKKYTPTEILRGLGL
jgi:hypothetical protein